MNFRLFFLLILLESVSIIAGVFVLLLFFFLYFGSGAGASSEKAMLTENIAFTILFVIPLFFGMFKFKYVEEKQKAKSYLYSGLIVTLVGGIYFVINS